MHMVSGPHFQKFRKKITRNVFAGMTSITSIVIQMPVLIFSYWNPWLGKLK